MGGKEGSANGVVSGVVCFLRLSSPGFNSLEELTNGSQMTAAELDGVCRW